MLEATNKHITIQFHFHDNYLSSKRLNSPVLPDFKHKSHVKTTKNHGIQLLETFAKRNSYDYELYRLKEELHLKVPENRLQKHIIQNNKAQLQNHNSSNNALNQESLSLINFIGDVVFNPSHGSASASLIRGFIKTSKDNRIFHYSKQQIENQKYKDIKRRFESSFQHTRLNSTRCLGIVDIGDTSKISINNKANNQLDFSLSSEIQFAKSFAPDIQLVSYTGISILSALKTAITDKINQPNLIVLNYTCPIFELSETELQELNHWIAIAKAQDILIISPNMVSNKSKIEKESLVNKLNLSLKAEISKHEKLDIEPFPVDYQGRKYLIPMPEMNTILWALRLLSISSDFNHNIRTTSKLTRKFFKNSLNQNQLQDLNLPFIMPETKNEDEYFQFMSAQTKKQRRLL
jgi:hypothetical protein